MLPAFGLGPQGLPTRSMPFRFASALVLAATAAVAGWILVRNLVWIEGEGRLLALAGVWEIVVAGLLAAVALWTVGGLRGRRRVVLFGLAVTLLALLLVRDLLPRRPEVGAPGEVAVERPTVRTLWVCVDGLSWSRALPLVRAGRMPHLARLLATGSTAVLESEATYRASAGRWGWWSPVIWTSLATGRRPETHGITDFSLPDPTRPLRRNGEPRLRAASSFHRRVPAVWNLFSAFGRRVGIVGWWGTWPAEEVEGLLVTDRVGLRSRKDLNDLESSEGIQWFGGQKDLTAPPSFLREIADEIGLPPHPRDWVEEEIYPFDSHPIVDADAVATFHAVLWQDQLYVRVAERILQTRPDLDLITVYIEGVDVLSHRFWHYMADPEARPGLPLPAGFDAHRHVVDAYHEHVDAYLGRLLEAAGEPLRIVLTSDHGFRLTPDKEFPADHSGFGTVLLAGDGIRRGKTALSLAGVVAGRVSVLDVLPTVLYWNGLPLASELEGRPLYRFFRRGYLREHAELRIDSYGDFAENRAVEIPLPDASDEEYLERLKALGYIQ